MQLLVLLCFSKDRYLLCLCLKDLCHMFRLIFHIRIPSHLHLHKDLCLRLAIPLHNGMLPSNRHIRYQTINSMDRRPITDHLSPDQNLLLPRTGNIIHHTTQIKVHDPLYLRILQCSTDHNYRDLILHYLKHLSRL